MNPGDKYRVPKNESQVLPNKLGLTCLKEIEKIEAKGFVRAFVVLLEELNPQTNFNVEYIKRIHQLALGSLYDFAGKYRVVNLSKGGFTFPAARHLEVSMNFFQNDILSNLSTVYKDDESLITDVSMVHGNYYLFTHFGREMVEQPGCWQI